MKNAVRHIAIYFLSATLLVASTGFSVCCLFGCHSQLTTGIEEKGCCEKEACELPAGQQKKECSGCNAQYVGLDLDFLLASANFEINLPSTIDFQQSIDFSEYHISFKTSTCQHSDLPPPAYGKALLPWVQAFLC